MNVVSCLHWFHPAEISCGHNCGRVRRVGGGIEIHTVSHTCFRTVTSSFFLFFFRSRESVVCFQCFQVMCRNGFWRSEIIAVGLDRTAVIAKNTYSCQSKKYLYSIHRFPQGIQDTTLSVAQYTLDFSYFYVENCICSQRSLLLCSSTEIWDFNLLSTHILSSIWPLRLKIKISADQEGSFSFLNPS